MLEGYTLGSLGYPHLSCELWVVRPGVHGWVFVFNRDTLEESDGHSHLDSRRP